MTQKLATPISILSGPLTERSRVRLDCPDCAKAKLHGTIIGFPLPRVADLIWDELWEGDVIEVKTQSSICPSYMLDNPLDRLPVSRLKPLPIQTMHLNDFTDRYGGNSLTGFHELVVYCGRRVMDCAITGDGSPLANPYKVKDCKQYLKDLDKATSGDAPLRLACNRFRDVLRHTIKFHTKSILEWQKLDLNFSDLSESGNLLTTSQVKTLIEAEHRGTTISNDTAIARYAEYNNQALRAVNDAKSGFINVHLKRINHQELWDELCRLVQVYREGRPMVLLCWCRGHCHTYAIARAIEYLASTTTV